MKRLEKILLELENSLSGWQKKIAENSQELYENEKFNELFAMLLKEIRKEYKENRKATQEYLKNNLEEAYESISKYIIDSLKGYDATKKLRILQEENVEHVKMIIRYLFENNVVNYDINFRKNYKIYFFDSEKEFIKLAQVLKSLTQYYVKKHYTVKSISDDFMHETELNKEICDCFATLVRENYSTLFLHTILDKLGDLEERISSIEDWIYDYDIDEDEDY